jgi:menaquinone-9 beta-reductase
MDTSCIIIGGSIAGLSCAIRLKEMGITPLVIDAGSYPCHKVCGEFLSPEALPLLKKWGITPSAYVSSMKIYKKEKFLIHNFHQEAGTLCRYELDQLLLNKAHNMGIPIKCNTAVTKIESNGLYKTVHTSTHETYNCSQIVLTTGRANKLLDIPTKSPVYIGFKAHFSGIDLSDCLEMHLIKGGYLGMVAQGKGQVNIAGIVKKELYDKYKDIHLLLEEESCFKKIAAGNMLFAEWMVAAVPPFGVKKKTHHKNTYILGDAAGAIAPICGAGLTLSLSSGLLAAKYIAKNDCKGFQKAWIDRYRFVLRFGNLLNYVVTREKLSSIAFQTVQKAPFLPYLLQKCGKVNL